MKKIYSLAAFFLLSGVLFAQAPTLLTDLHPGTSTNSSGVTTGNNSSPSNLIVFNGELYFSGDDASGTNTGGVDLGRELWKTDGTPAGTVLVKNIRSGDSSSSPFNFFIFNGNLYFSANDGAVELWTTDGTDAGTTKVDLLPSINGDVPNNATNYLGDVYLTLNANGDNNQLFQWSGFDSTGMIDGEFAEDSVNPASITQVFSIVEFDNSLHLYMNYSPDDAQDIGRELYKYDVATNIYTLIADISPGLTNSGNPASASISNFTPFLTNLYYEALGKLYRTDPNGITEEVPAALALGLEGVNNLARMDDQLLFEADDQVNGDQLYSLNNTTGVITQLSFITGANNNHDPSDFLMFNNFVYYAGEDANDQDRHLWRTDGVTTQQLDDTVKDVDDIVEFNGLLYFEGEDPAANNGAGSGNELFVYDPATASVDQLTGLGSLRLAQNPAERSLEIVGDLNEAENYTIYDLSGRKVQEGTLNDSTIDQNLKTGTYILQITGSDKSHSIKFIVK